DVSLKLPSLPPPRGLSSYKLSISSAPQAPTLVLEQLTTARTSINSCLDVVDATTWTGDAKNANFISGQLQLLFENVQEANQSLKGRPEMQKNWWENPVDEKIFDPPLPPNLSFHLSISEAALVLHIRTLDLATPSTPITPAPSYSGFSIRDRLAVALGGTRPPMHDEASEYFPWKGQDVRVKDKVRVESQDPSLMAAMAKLSALEHNVALSRRALDAVMGRDES
ncbi:hypothetical protein LTR39_002660, partial [Cryomyces antarcticus]